MRALFWTLPLLLVSAQVSAQTPTPRTMKRSVDTVVIKGNQLGPHIMGTHKSRIRVYACRASSMVPIAYQVDERNRDGVFCYDSGPSKFHVRDENSRIDANDEMVVLVKDAGDRANERVLGQVPGFKNVQEIELWDPLDKSKAWIYLYHFPRDPIPIRLPVDLVDLRTKRYDEEEQTCNWFGEYFHFNNDRSRMNAVRATYLAIGRSRLRDYRKVPNLLDSTQVRAVVSFMMVTVVRQSNDIKVDLGGVINGPLRVVAENRLKVLLGLGYHVEAPSSHVILWRNKISMPTNARCPITLSSSKESSYSLCLDMNKSVIKRGWKFFNSRNSTPVVIDGRRSRAERLLDFRWPAWNCMFGPEGAIITKFVVPPFLRNRKGSKLVFVDDEYHKREEETGIEFQRGAIGLNGYIMDMRGLRKGVYPGDYIVWYAPAGFKPGDEKGYLNEIDHPVRVRPTDALR